MKKIKLNKKHKRTNSTKWLERHLNDEFFLKSKKDGHRSRASYKLLQIEQKCRVFIKRESVLDYG